MSSDVVSFEVSSRNDPLLLRCQQLTERMTRLSAVATSLHQKSQSQAETIVRQGNELTVLKSEVNARDKEIEELKQKYQATSTQLIDLQNAYAQALLNHATELNTMRVRIAHLERRLSRTRKALLALGVVIVVVGGVILWEYVTAKVVISTAASAIMHINGAAIAKSAKTSLSIGVTGLGSSKIASHVTRLK